MNNLCLTDGQKYGAPLAAKADAAVNAEKLHVLQAFMFGFICRGAWSHK